jgi:hypothetical protein
MKNALFPAFLLLTAGLAAAQPQPDKQTPESTEIWSPVPRVVTPGAMGMGMAQTSGSSAPSDAVVLFDGKDLTNWVSDKDPQAAAPWTVQDGAMIVKAKAGDVRTKQEFENYQLHIEFRTPAQVEGTGQGRGNSGIFMQGLYELQVLDNYDNRTYSNGQAGSIYKQTMPLVNACKKPGEWQTYDVVYTAPRFNKDGMMIDPPYITVLQNGILVQNHTKINGPTPYIGLPDVKAHGKGPIKLQDHGNPTAFRNIWIREI